jgi:hypothetical protein
MPKLIVSRPTQPSPGQQLDVGGVASAVASGSQLGRIQRTQAPQAIESGVGIANEEIAQGRRDYQRLQKQAAANRQAQQNQGNNKDNQPSVPAAQNAGYGQTVTDKNSGIQTSYGDPWAQSNANRIQDVIPSNAAVYDTVQSNAMVDFNQQASDYMNEVTAPVSGAVGTYSKAATLAQPKAVISNLDTIAENVKNKYSPALLDGQSKANFDQSMGQIANNHKSKATADIANAQGDVRVQALAGALDNDVRSGLLDSPENIGFYAGQAMQRITNAVSEGSISPEQSQKLTESVRKGLFLGSLQASNKTNPGSVGKLLASKTPDELNITQVEYNQLKNQNKAALLDKVNGDSMQYKAQTEIANAKNRVLYSGLNSGIKDGSIQSAQIVSAYDKGDINFQQYTTLLGNYQTAIKDNNGKLRTRLDISSAITAGDTLQDFSNKDIDDHYKNEVRSRSQDGTLNLDIATKTQIASQYKGPVDSYAKEIKYGIMSNDPKIMKDALFGFNKIQEENPLALMNIKDSKFMAYASALSDAYEHTTDFNKEGIQKIYDSVYNVDGRTRKSRENAYGGEEAFKPENIRNTIAAITGNDTGFFSRAVFNTDEVSDSTVDYMRPLLKQAYMETGDANAAIETVKNQTKAIFGHSQVNEQEKLGFNPGASMFLPPELVYGSKAKPEEMRLAINKEIAPILPKDVDPSKVMVGSDDLTLAQYRQQGKRGAQPVSYYLYYKDGAGKDVLLPQRWVFDATSKAHIDIANKAIVERKIPVDNITQPNKVIGPLSNNQPETLHAVVSNTKGFGTSPILNREFLDKAGQAAFVSQIVGQYPGDPQQRPVVGVALNKMIGKDQSSWRVGQALKFVNSVLTNNADPKTYLKFGTATTSPEPGDVVVGKMGAGLFAGQQVINGQKMVSVVAMNGNNLSISMIPLAEVRGFRKTPTPEQFYRQDAPLSTNNLPVRFNPYTGEAARVPTQGDRFNPYTGEAINSTEEPIKKNTIINPATGEMVDASGQFGQGTATSAAGGHIEVTNQGQNTDQYSISNSSKEPSKATQEAPILTNSGELKTNPATDQIVNTPNEIKKGDKVVLGDGTVDEFNMYQNGKVRLKSGKIVEQSDIKPLRGTQTSSDYSGLSTDIKGALYAKMPEVQELVRQQTSGNFKNPIDVGRAYGGLVNSDPQAQIVLDAVFKRALGSDIKTEDSAYCAAFVSAILKDSGYAGAITTFSDPKELPKLGFKETKTPQRGDIVFLAGHVGFFYGKDPQKPGNVVIAGGNQGTPSGVNLITRPESEVIGYYSLPEGKKLRSVSEKIQRTLFSPNAD